MPSVNVKYIFSGMYIILMLYIPLRTQKVDSYFPACLAVPGRNFCHKHQVPSSPLNEGRLSSLLRFSCRCLSMEQTCVKGDKI